MIFDMLQPPSTLDEAVDRLLLILTPEEQLQIAVLKQDDLINLHFSLGLEIRNAFGLHYAESKLLKVCGTDQADGASMVILEALWVRLCDTY